MVVAVLAKSFASFCQRHCQLSHTARRLEGTNCRYPQQEHMAQPKRYRSEPCNRRPTSTSHNDHVGHVHHERNAEKCECARTALDRRQKRLPLKEDSPSLKALYNFLGLCRYLCFEALSSRHRAPCDGLPGRRKSFCQAKSIFPSSSAARTLLRHLARQSDDVATRSGRVE